MGHRWQNYKDLTFFVFIALIIASGILYFLLKDQISLDEFRLAIREFGVWAPLIFVVVYIVGTIFIPSTPFMAMAGILFGFKYGVLYSALGGLVSSILVYGISRKLGKVWVESILEKEDMQKLNSYNERLEQGAVLDLILLRMAPVMPFNVLNIIMGISRIKTKDYIVGTILGLIPSNIATVYIGTFITKIF